MTLPSGQISFSEVNVELSRPSTQQLELNDSAVRTLAGVGGSGTVISMSNLQGKSNRVAISLVLSTQTINYNLWDNRSPAYVAGTSDVTFTVNPGVALNNLQVPNQFSPADTVRIVNQGLIAGFGGAFDSASMYGVPGNGTVQPTNNGKPGQSAITVQRAVTIQNQGVIAGGGGGGGGGGPSSGYPVLIPRPPRSGGPISGTGYSGGGGGGVGAGVIAQIAITPQQGGQGGSGNPLSAAVSGQPGLQSTTSPGPGVPASTLASYFAAGAGGLGGGGGSVSAGNGGTGGGLGQAGQAGQGGNLPTGGGAGGSAGNYIEGIAFVTFQGPAGDVRGNSA